MKNIVYFSLFLSALTFSAVPIKYHDTGSQNRDDSMDERAKGYLLAGKAKTATTNYGNFISWGSFTPSGYNGEPAGLWGNYTYIPHLSFMTAIPGQSYSCQYQWVHCETIGDSLNIWCSTDAYNAWVANDNTNFVGIVFEAVDDDGVVGIEVSSIDEIFQSSQWGINHDSGEIFMSLPIGENVIIDPNVSNVYGDQASKKGVGLIYPWALRPKLVERLDDYDVYDYGVDGIPWNNDDEYTYYGANTAESWFTRLNPSSNTDWQAATGGENTHNPNLTAGDIFGNTIFTDPDDTYPLLAHSDYIETWPEDETGSPFWPGNWAEAYNPDSTNCSPQTASNPDCWIENPGTFISDNDVYMEFDDSRAHRGNMVNENNEYEQTGYPMGLKVMATGHSYGVSYAEDMIIFTITIRNESGDWCAFKRDEYGNHVPVVDESGSQICGDAMLLPDGTSINNGQGFNYKHMTSGFYFDADVVTSDIEGNFNVHSNNDDFMEYYIDSTGISLAMIYDYNYNSNGADDVGIVAIQLLDTPLAREPIDLDQDGNVDIYPGEPLKMTDWHWFDWFNRPGVVEHESGIDGFAGDPEHPQARNKEEIMYKLMAGDTTNISLNEKEWFFHTDNPNTDSDSDLNPHLDSVEGLYLTPEFLNGDDGLDCVFIMSCGPFDLDVGEEVTFTFSTVFGEDMNDIIENARKAEFVHDNHFLTVSAPIQPQLTVEPGINSISLSWDDSSEFAADHLTGITDFEGYRIYRSIDGGATWGDDSDMIFDDDGNFAGWQPYLQFDLTHAEDMEQFGHDISGPDPAAPWMDLGSNSGLAHSFIDTNVYNYMEYCYAISAYDSGILSGYTTPSGIFFENGIESVESDYTVTITCQYPGTPDIIIPATDILFNKNENHLGWSQITYTPFDIDQMINADYQFEIEADTNTYAFMLNKTLNPRLYIYQINQNGNPSEYSDISSISISFADSILQLPGADILDTLGGVISYRLPDYIMSEFPILPIDDPESSQNWFDFLGLNIKIENNISLFPNSKIAEIDSIIWLTDPIYSNGELLSSSMHFVDDSDIFYRQPFFDYVIEFGEPGLDTAIVVIPPSGCFENETLTLLPFRIVNIQTGEKVNLIHTDKGSFFEEDSGTCYPACSNLTEYCNNGICEPNPGFGDCEWTRNEEVLFKEKGIDINEPLTEYYTYRLKFNWSIQDIEFNNQFPWTEQDSMIIKPRKQLHDGDSWTVDMGIFFGQVGGCTDPEANNYNPDATIDDGSCNYENIQGDLNGDSQLDVLDVIQLVAIILETTTPSEYQLSVADINGDGNIEILDVVLLVGIILG